MWLDLDDETVEHLRLLDQLPKEVAQEFCLIGLKLLLAATSTGSLTLTATLSSRRRQFEAAAAKLGTDVTVSADHIQRCVQALAHCFLLAAKQGFRGASHLRPSLARVQPRLEPTTVEVVADFYETEAGGPLTIRLAHPERRLDLAHYDRLEWRLEADVASRRRLDVAEDVPNVSVNLRWVTCRSGVGVGGPSSATTLLQTDPATLKRVTEELERALKAAQSPAARRAAKWL